jgi:sugar phosphate isomerase/epimerase
MNWPDIFQALNDTGDTASNKWLTVELYPFETTAEDAARKAFAYLRQFL